MKKLLLITLCILTLTACKDKEKEKLYILNWGEYMDMEVVKDFEEKFNCEVVYDEVSSNGEMYTRMISETTKYDVVFPSQYLVGKMISEDLLQPIDKTIVKAFDNVYPLVLDILKTMDSENAYIVPYTWGTLGIMYQKSVEDLVFEHGYGVLFEDIKGIEKKGMYDQSREAVGSCLLYLEEDVNTTDVNLLNEVEAILKKANFTKYADDILKTDVASGNLDVALVYSGDYLTQLIMDQGQEINYGYYVPDYCNLWVDAIAIPKNSQNPELANEFINYIMQPEVNYIISSYIGYCPVLPEVTDMLAEDDFMKNIVADRAFIPFREGMVWQGYTYLGEEHYKVLDDIYTRVKGY